MKQLVIFEGYWSREDIKKFPPQYFFLFGDNLEEQGTGGQACIRGCTNAIGIPTKVSPRGSEDAYFTPSDCLYKILLSKNANMILSQIEKNLQKIPEDAIIVMPEAGLGTGLAQLDKRAPNVLNGIYAYLEHALGIDLEGFYVPENETK